MKYLMAVVKFGKGETRSEKHFPCIFSNLLCHDLVAKNFLGSLREHFPDSTISLVSAGEYEPASGTCSGHSQTLNLKSDPEDETRIGYNDYF